MAEDDSGKAERPVAAEEQSEFVDSVGFADGAFVESDGDGEAFVIGERSGGADFDTVAGDFGSGVAIAGPVSARENVGADIFCFDGKGDGGGDRAQRNVPVVAGDVPVELVVIFEEAEGVGDGVLDIDGLDGIVGVVDEDFEMAIVADAGGFVLEIVAGGVGDTGNGEEEGIVHPLRGDVFDGDVAIEAVPGSADEVDGDGFGDVDGGVGEDGDLGVEFFDA